MAKGDIKIPAAIRKDKRLSWPSKAIVSVLEENAALADPEELSLSEIRQMASVTEEELGVAFEELIGAGYLQTTKESVAFCDAGSLSVGMVLRATFAMEAQTSLFGQKDDAFSEPFQRTREQAGYQAVESSGTVYKVRIEQVKESEESDGTLYYRLDVTAQDLGQTAEPIVKVEDQRFPNRDEAWEWWDGWVSGLDDGAATVLDFEEPDITAEPDPSTEPEEADEESVDGRKEFSVQLEDGEHVKVRIDPEGRGWFMVQFFGPVNEAGHFTRKTRRGEFKEDEEGWALRLAQQMRTAFVEQSGGF